MNPQFITFQAREHISDMQHAAAQERLARAAANSGNGLLARLAQRLKADLQNMVRAGRSAQPTLVAHEDVTRH